MTWTPVYTPTEHLTAACFGPIGLSLIERDVLGRGGPMRLKILAAAMLTMALTPAPAEARGFIALEAADAETVAAWYASTFDLSEVKRVDGDTATIIVLDGAPLAIEIIQRSEKTPKVEGRRLGIAKAGAVMADLDAAVARWRADGVTFFGNGNVFYDEEMDRRTVILLDPEDNRVQLFSPLCGGQRTAVACR